MYSRFTSVICVRVPLCVCMLLIGFLLLASGCIDSGGGGGGSKQVPVTKALVIEDGIHPTADGHAVIMMAFFYALN